MASRIIVHGRVLARPREVMSANWRPPVVRVDPVDELGRPTAQPVYAREAPRAGVPWEDEDGTVYRVVARLDAREGWVAAETVMGWYRVPYAEVARWVRVGLLDGAREAASPAKRYRVLDALRARQEAARYQHQHGDVGTAPAGRPGRARRRAPA